jgi:hypothetical protein
MAIAPYRTHPIVSSAFLAEVDNLGSNWTKNTPISFFGEPLDASKKRSGPAARKKSGRYAQRLR